MNDKNTPYFPLFVSLKGKNFSVIGAGKVASRRVNALLEFGVRITVTAPKYGASLEQLADKGRIELNRRGFCPSDLEGADFCIAATDNRKTNHKIYLLCQKRGIPANIADCKEECDFYFPALARKGMLVAGICAGGRDHRLAKEAAGEVRALFEAMGKRKAASDKSTD